MGDLAIIFMLSMLLNYIHFLPAQTTFTYEDVCIACFGHPVKSLKLAASIQNMAFNGKGYIVVSATASGANIYKKL